MRLLVITAILALLSTACAGGDASAPDGSPRPSPPDGADGGEISLGYEFDGGSDGWASEVTDFTEATRPEDLLSATTDMPADVSDEAGPGAFHLAASNRSDDLFLYMYRAVGHKEGVAPGTTYDVTMTVSFASRAPSNCAGIGGAPGESVYLKVGAAPEEPLPAPVEGDSRLTVDKGNQSSGGRYAVVAGDVANGIPCEEALEQDPPPAAMIERTGTVEGVTSTAHGRLWLFVGTDSGFEGRTSVYYDRIDVTLTPVS